MKNKSLLMTIAILIIAMNLVAQVKGTFIDSRDGKTYKTVKIGTQTWMAENLSFKASSGCWAYDNDESNVLKYGYLYNWETAINVCPSGWHLPTDEEWKTLIEYLGGLEVAGKKMKSTSGWYSNGNGTNSSGFSALPGGWYLNTGMLSSFKQVVGYGDWWSSSEENSSQASWRGLKWDLNLIGVGIQNKACGMSVRCIKD